MKLHYKLRTWLYLAIVTNLISFGDSCTIIDGITFSGARDDADSSFVLWNQTVEGSITAYNFEPSQSVLVLTLTVQDGSTLVEITPGQDYADFVDIDPRDNTLNTNLIYKCIPTGGSEEDYSSVVFAFFDDVNTRPTEFYTSDLSLTIPSDWKREVPINWDNVIKAYDSDFDESNAEFVLEFNPDWFEYSTTPLWVSGERPPKYETEIAIYLKSEGIVLNSGIQIINATAINGPFRQTLTINLDITPVNLFPPVFDQYNYYLKLTSWPEIGDNVPISIKASDPDFNNTRLKFEIDSTLLVISDPYANPPEITFIKGVNEGDLESLIQVSTVTVTEEFEDSSVRVLSSKVALILEFPQMVLSTLPVFDKNLYRHSSSDWLTPDDPPLDVELSADTDGTEEIVFEVVNSNGLAEIVDRNKIHFLRNTQEESLENGVVFLEILAYVKEDPTRSSTAVVAILFPILEADCLTTTSESSVSDSTTCLPCSTECPEPETPTTPPEDSGTTTVCPEVPDCPSTPYPDEGTSTLCDCDGGSSPEPSTCPDIIECPFTPDPSTGTCAPCDDCSTTTESTSTCPECPYTPDPSSGTCEPCDNCSTTTESTSTCPECPYTPDPSSGTCAPCDNCSTTTESTSTCPECPYTPDPSSGTCAPCDNCSTTTESTSTCPECPYTPDPSSGTCAPCPSTPTCPTTPSPTSCPPATTCPPVTECPFTPDPETGTCAPCPTTARPGDNNTTITPQPLGDCPVKASNTGLVAGIAVLSVVAVCSIGAAAYFFWKVKDLGSAVVDPFFKTRQSFGNINPSPPTGRRGTLRVNTPLDAETGGGFTNPGFVSTVPQTTSSLGRLEEVLSIPDPSATAVAASSTTPNTSGWTSDEPQPYKSALAKPKEINPDYDEGPKPNSSSNSQPTRARGGVKIADEVEIINNDEEELLQDSSSDTGL